MKRPGVPLTLEVLLEEAKFILRTLQRTDLFGEQVQFTEAERILDSSISLNFTDYSEFLEKFGYIRSDPSANWVEVSEEGSFVASDGEDSTFHARLARHFSREIEAAVRPTPPPEPVPPPSLRPSIRPAVTEGRGPEELVDRRFRKEKMIGEGTLGPVFRARQMSLGRTVVLKEVKTVFQLAPYLRRDELLLRLRERLEAQASLESAFVVEVLDHNLEREAPYFVVRSAAMNLRTLLDASEGRRLSPPTAARIVIQILAGLDHAHEQGVMHLGLKPENILIDDAGNVRIADFGLATLTDRPPAEGSLSQPPMVVGGGLIPYLAPERLRLTGDYHPSTDLYTVGMLAYEMLTSKLPGRRSPLPSEAVDGLPAGFDDIFDRLTRDEVDERFPSASVVLERTVQSLPSEWVGDGSMLPFSIAPVLPSPEPVSD